MHQRYRDLAPVQSCLSLSPGVSSLPLAPLSPGATGPAWPSIAGVSQAQLRGMGVSRASCSTTHGIWGEIQGSPLLPQAVSTQLSRVSHSPLIQGPSVYLRGGCNPLGIICLLCAGAVARGKERLTPQPPPSSAFSFCVGSGE